MKATGIVRRIDDLGRVVIPKEIRRTMRIREGDPLEIYTDKDGEVIFKKYSAMGEWSDPAQQMCESVYKTAGTLCAICDRDAFISVSGLNKRDLVTRRIAPELDQMIMTRKTYQRGPSERGMALADGLDRYIVDIASPIQSEGDIIGCVVLFSDGTTPSGDAELKIAQTVASFLGRQFDN
ncbi:MAG: AbrB/MazE/SpoVT family DNA-binding domain-containing protein [Oscillospiraceae bacterium]|jgi:AbrB family transcriptional regulator (stage V sporulation protein T)|nr:AbrB/MazE/SpoVT family DNA-binding domain-containing protein [Oscillospiraceae bacterium]